MDPNAALEFLRGYFHKRSELEDLTGDLQEGWSYRMPGDNTEKAIREEIERLKTEIELDADRAVECFHGLDQWLSTGGFLPKAWSAVHFPKPRS